MNISKPACTDNALCIHAAAQLQIPARLEEVDQHYITNTILKTKITTRVY
jgi:hypothetical protein